MRQLVLVVLLLVATLPATAQTHSTEIETRLTSSRFLGLLEFTVSASGGQADPMFRRLFEASDFAALDSEALRRLADLDLGVYNYSYSGYPATHGQTVGAWTFFRMAAAKASGWSDLWDRTAGFFPNDVQRTIVQAMRDLEPAYDALLWDPYGVAVQRKADSLAVYLERHDIGSLVYRLAEFYGSAWPVELPLWIALHPFPPQRPFSAGVFGNVAVSGMSPGFDNYGIYANIVLHEASHQLFAQQPPALAHAIQTVMLESDSPTRRLAYRWLDEALATAATNGWAYKQLTGSLDAESWYNDRIIDGYARAIYPRVAEYIEAGRTIDEEFLRSALSRFETTFPEAATDPDALFPFFSLVTDAEADLNTLIGPLFERYRLRGVSMTTVFSGASLEAALSTPALTIVLLTDPTPEKHVLLRKHLPPAMLNAPGEAVFIRDPRDHPIILLRLDEAAALRRVLDRIEAEGLQSLSPTN
jgi:hypothetical protein